MYESNHAFEKFLTFEQAAEKYISCDSCVVVREVLANSQSTVSKIKLMRIALDYCILANRLLRKIENQYLYYKK